MPHAFYILFFFALGACVGSFLNVVVWRLPRNESLVTPPSRCPICETRLAWYDNVPVFGWLALRGRCRYCHTPISAEYPTVELITGLLFVLYYVAFYILHLGPCWIVDGVNRLGEPDPRAIHVQTIAAHWPQYLLAVFTVSCLLAASLIDGKLYFIPQSIPIVLTIFGLLYHTILDRPREPGALSVQSGTVAALTVGATLGLLISLALLYTGRLARSFDKGWPALEIEKDPPPEKPAHGAIARLVRRWIDNYRRPLTPEQQQSLSRAQAAAKTRDAEEAARRKREDDAEHAKNPQPVVQEFTKAMIRAEIRKEMTFLLPPIALALLAATPTIVFPDAGAKLAGIVRNHHWLGGLLGSLLGGLVGAFTVWLTRILGSLAFGREAMGMGDVDLMFGVGAVVGAGAATVAFFAAPFFGLALAIYMLIVGKRRELPYGPYLSLGTAFVMIYYCPVALYLRPGMTALAQILFHRAP
jgi:leader peptidase (prepilin peptidase)/N-methyltransferase